MVPALDQAQKVLTQDLKDHADVHAVGTFVVERVEQADDMFPAGVVHVGLNDLVEQFDLVQSSFGVVGGRAHDLESDVLACVVVAREPDSREMAPAQLAHDRVFAIVVFFTNLDGVVAALAVVFRVLLVGRVFGLLVARE